MTEDNIKLMKAWCCTCFKMQSVRSLKVPSCTVKLWIPGTFWVGL